MCQTGVKGHIFKTHFIEKISIRTFLNKINKKCLLWIIQNTYKHFSVDKIIGVLL